VISKCDTLLSHPSQGIMAHVNALVGAYSVTVSNNKSMLKERTIPSYRLIAGFLCRLYGSHLLRDAIFSVDELEYSTIVN